MKDFLKIKKIEDGWRKALKEEFEKDYFKTLLKYLDSRSKEAEIFPEFKDCFAAFNKTPLSDVKVVVLGQDPYHGPGQAHGLSFSVPEGVKIPPSLRNIYKELTATFKGFKSENGDLNFWAEQGVFLLNSVLTVESGQAASHKGQGWEEFTDEVLRVLNAQERPIVYLLWGAYAHKKAQIIDNKKHFILKAPHPSPLSAHRGFLGCDHFLKANKFLKKKGIRAIKWGL